MIFTIVFFYIFLTKNAKCHFQFYSFYISKKIHLSIRPHKNQKVFILKMISAKMIFELIKRYNINVLTKNKYEKIKVPMRADKQQHAFFKFISNSLIRKKYKYILVTSNYKEIEKTRSTVSTSQVRNTPPTTNTELLIELLSDELTNIHLLSRR